MSALQLGVTFLTTSVVGAGALAQSAADGAPDDQLLWSGGGVALGIVVGWWLIRWFGLREERALARADALLSAERDTYTAALETERKLRAVEVEAERNRTERYRQQLIDERARRLAAERLLEQRHRGDTRRPPVDVATVDAITTDTEGGTPT